MSNTQKKSFKRFLVVYEQGEWEREQLREPYIGVPISSWIRSKAQCRPLSSLAMSLTDWEEESRMEMIKNWVPMIHTKEGW